MKFNAKSRKTNAMLASVGGVIEQMAYIIVSFIFRTVFLRIFTEEYLGLSGLFTNIIQIFSLAELGIGSAIVYRAYAPIKENDTTKIAALMDFYKNIYRIIFGVIIFAGILFMPFLSVIIKEPSEIPADINIQLVYMLFVLQSASSYLYVYKQSVLQADQKAYAVSTVGTVNNIMTNLVKIAMLYLTKDYVLVLVSGIVTSLFINIIFNFYITKKYKEIFSLHIKLDKKERREIYKDAAGLMCHRIGGTVVTSTDNIILSKFAGLGIVGIYSNYSLLTASVLSFVNKVLNSFVASVGNYAVEKNAKEKKQLYKRLLFLNLWISSFCTICLYTLLNPFIFLWQGERFLLEKSTVLIICIQFFIQSSIVISGVFVNACGLFMKDKLRPLIEAVLNLTVSIVLVQYMGIVGVFVGTIVSALVTYWWRQPYLLYRHVFKEKLRDFMVFYLLWVVLTAFLLIVSDFVCGEMLNNITFFIVRLLGCIIGVNLSFCLVTFRTEYFKYFYNFIMQAFISKRKKKSN